MDADTIAARLSGTRFVAVEWVARTVSTNDDLAAAARNGAAEGTVRIADYQSGGRGRMGRRWEAPPAASLMFSVLLRPPARLSEEGRLPLVTACAGLALAAAAAQLVGDVVRLKWPNDLTVEPDKRKLAGILAEVVLDPSHGPAVVVGCGCNVNWPSPMPDELAGTAASLNHVAGSDVDRAELLIATLSGLERRYATLVADGPERLLAEYRDECGTLGTTVRIELPGGSFTGRAVEIDGRGALVVETGDGLRTVEVGDVVHLRAAPATP